MGAAVRHRKGQRSGAILDTAAKLFRERGYNGTGIDDIGAAMELTGPAVYHYFSGKQQLLADIAAQVIRRLEVAARHSASCGSANTIALDVVDGLVSAALADPDGVAVCLRQLNNLDEPARTSCDARLRDLVVTLCPAAGVDDGHLRARAGAGMLVSMALAKTPLQDNLVDLGTRMMRRLLAVPLPQRPRVRVLASSPSDELRRRAARAFRKEAIIAEAAALFRERGFHGVSLRDIGAAVGITGSAVNRHFQSKEALLGAAFARLGEQIGSGIYRALKGAPDAEAAVEGVLASYIAIALTSRDLVAVNMSEMHHLSTTDRQERRKRQRSYAEELSYVLTEAHPDMSKPESSLRARAAYALVNEVVANDDLSSRQGLVEDLLVLALAVVRPAPDADGVGTA